MWIPRAFGLLQQDIRYAGRTFAKNPGFASIAVLTLALGIGANTAIFTLLDQILLRLLPVQNPQQLVLLTMSGKHYGNNWGGNAISHPMFRDFQQHNEVFSGMFCRFPTRVSLTVDGRAERVAAELVSGTYFDVLGITPTIGRTFTPEDDRVPSGHPYAVLSYDYWKSRFSSDPTIIGKSVLINNYPITIIGVAQPGFTGVELGNSAKLFIPVMMQPQMVNTPMKMLTDRRSRWVNAFGRLKPGVSQTQAKASLQPYMHSMLEMEVREQAFHRASAFDREQFLKCWIDVLPGSQGRSYTRRQLSTPLWVLMAITAIVLLIACANIANLLLARATGRRKEIAVRLAVGASRSRLVAQLITESLLLSTLGAICGLALAFGADKALMAAYLPADSGGLNISTAPDLRILAFTLVITCLTGIVFGLVPALQSTKTDVARTLKDEAGGVLHGAHSGLKKVLVIAQVTLSLLLLVASGLFLRSLNNLRNLGPGFPVAKLVGFNIDPSLSGYTPERTKLFYQRVTENLTSIPGVQNVALAAVRILEDNEWDSSMTAEGYSPSKPADRPQPYMNQISPNYFATMGVPIIAGRDFTNQDTREVKHFPDRPDPEGWFPTTVIINEKFAKKYFPGRNPVGYHLGFGSDPGTPTDMEIIGVVKDIKYTNLRDDIPEQAFIPYLAGRFIGGMTVYLRTAADPNQLLPIVRERVRQLDANIPIYSMRTTEEQITNSLRTERLIASLSSAFGFLATLLAIIGLYGVMAYTVAQRTREIGIRMTLGAERASVIWMVMREVLLLVAVGVIIGLPTAITITRIVRSQLYGVTPYDPITLTLSIIGLAAVACVAGYLPALRASRVDPMRALRYE